MAPENYWSALIVWIAENFVEMDCKTVQVANV